MVAWRGVPASGFAPKWAWRALRHEAFVPRHAWRALRQARRALRHEPFTLRHEAFTPRHAVFGPPGLQKPPSCGQNAGAGRESAKRKAKSANKGRRQEAGDNWRGRERGEGLYRAGAQGPESEKR